MSSLLPGTLWCHFFKCYIKIAIFFLLGFILLMFIIQLNETQLIMGSFPKYNLSEGALLSIMRVPLLIQQTIPFINLLISMFVFFSLNKKNELIATRSAGISVWQFLLPFVTGSFLLGIFTILIINPIAVAGENITFPLKNKWREDTSNPMNDPNTIPWIHKRTNQENFILGAKKILKKEKILLNVTIIRFDKEDQIILRQEAESATIFKENILLKKVVEYKYGENPVLKDSVVTNVSIDIDDFEQYSDFFECIPFYYTIKRILFSKNPKSIGSRLSETRFYCLITTPLLLVSMTLIAACVSLKFSRSGQYLALISSGIFSGSVLYTITIIMKSFGKSGILLPFISAAVPIIIATSLSISFLLAKEDG
ncbi:LptF/LptG family permease [Liberibacter sp. Z1]|nr:LptF/LptG family permease [Candidatus Liberibacter sp.]